MSLNRQRSPADKTISRIISRHEVKDGKKFTIQSATAAVCTLGTLQVDAHTRMLIYWAIVRALRAHAPLIMWHMDQLELPHK